MKVLRWSKFCVKTSSTSKCLYTCVYDTNLPFFLFHIETIMYIIMDNFFSSSVSMLDLLKDGIYSCGTLQSNQIGFPDRMKPHLKKGLHSRGDYIVEQFKKAKGLTVSKQSKYLHVALWQDNKAVTVSATNCDPTSSTSVQRHQKRWNTDHCSMSSVRQHV